MYKIAEARKRKGLSQLDLANAIGTTQQQVAKWESGKIDPRVSSLEKIASALNVTLSYLLGLDDDPNFINANPVPTVRIPILGRIAAGTPREAFSCSDEWHDTPTTLVEHRKGCFWLVVAGNSMNRLFPEGSLVLIDPTAEVRDGDVAAVFVNGDDATIKRVEYDSGVITLYPESYDAEYRPRVIDQSDPDAPTFHAIGRVVSFTAPDGWRA
ncbi:MAG: helix-turn-helix domain-containing protein [Coriobacteriaceae bacterium]|nr:helix-turn-helix domain-containing protein [Coriobacteriaceae bacterium]